MWIILSAKEGIILKTIGIMPSCDDGGTGVQMKQVTVSWLFCLLVLLKLSIGLIKPNQQFWIEEEKNLLKLNEKTREQNDDICAIAICVSYRTFAP